MWPDYTRWQPELRLYGWHHHHASGRVSRSSKVVLTRIANNKSTTWRSARTTALVVASCFMLLGPIVGNVSAWQLPGIGDEASWRERKLHDLRSDDVRIRRDAARELARNDVDGTKLIDALMAAMSDEDFLVRRSVVIALRVHGAGRSDVANVFRNALVDCDPRLASELIHGLTVVDPNLAGSLDALVTAALRDDRNITPYAVEAMTKIGQPAVTPLVNMLKDPGWEVRENAIAGLVDLAEVARPATPKIVDAATLPSAFNVDTVCPKLVAWSDDAVVELVKLVKGGPESKATCAVDCLAWMEKEAAVAVPVLLEIAADTEVRIGVRSACLRALARVGESKEEVLRRIMKFAEEDRDKSFREAALTNLGQFGERAAPAVPLLVSIVRGDDSIRLRNAALHSLGWIKPKPDVVIPLCTEVLRGRDPDIIKQTAAWVVSKYGTAGAQAWPALKPMLRSDGDNRKAAIDAMLEVGVHDPTILPELRTIVREGGRFEREAAIKALSELGPSAADAIPDLLDIVQSDTNNGESAAYALGLILPDGAAVLPQITGDMRGWYEKGCRFRREHAQRFAPNTPEPAEQAIATDQRLSEIVGDVVVDGVGVEGVRVSLSCQRNERSEGIEVRLTTTDDLGTFRFPDVSDGRYSLVAFHPGHEPAFVYVEADRSRGMQPKRQQITLRPQEPATFTVVNGEEEPLSDVAVRITEYRSTPMPPVELRTDRAGTFSFPLGTGFVNGEADHPVYMRTRFVLSNDRNQASVVMLKPYRISGNVKDASTGAPIPSFSVTRGIRLGDSPALLGDGDQLGSFTDGVYEIRFEESVNLQAPFNRLALAFDAPGYQREISPAYSEGLGDLTFNIELAPRGGTTGRLIDGDGKPVAGAEVVLVVSDPMRRINLLNGRPDWTLEDSPQFTTSADGRFAFPPQSRRFGLLVADDRCFAFIMDRTFSAHDTIELTPWARLTGTVRSGNDVAAGALIDVAIEPLTPEPSLDVDQNRDGDSLTQTTEGYWHPSFRYSVQADERGEFSVDRVRPGRVRIGLLVPIHVNVLVSMVRKTVELAPGEEREVCIGGGGRHVAGRIDIPKRRNPFTDGLDRCASALGGVMFERTVEPQPSLHDALRMRGLPKLYHPFGFHEDGAFTISDVKPGKYRLVIGFQCANESGPPDYALDHEFELPEGDLAVPFDLGELKVTRIQQPD